ncbi:MAG TPA: hypothetical protein VMF89_33560 [Polyangiales bacterium]|nr:hypothetical protein [Polyangiales bacterium]
MSAAATSLLHTPCLAQDDPFIHGRLSLGLGLFFGYQFASEPSRSGFEWGFEAYATQRYGDVGACTNGPRSGFGPILQLGIKGVEDPRLTLAMRAGAELERAVVALTGEIGMSYRFGHDPGPSLHLGIVPESLVFNAALRHQLFRSETWVGVGLRYLPTFGEQGFCSEGRPLRLGQSKCVNAEPQPMAAGSDTALAAAAYAADAQMECISITAFVQLALELMAAEAPDALVERALAAAEDELRHTLQCKNIAEHLGSANVSCAVPEVSGRPFDSRQALLERLAVESYEDGCLGEGIAACQLAHGARLAADSGIAHTLRAIARDEAGHAQLAWDIVHFCIAKGGAPVRAALARSARRTRTLHWSDDPAPALERYGKIQPRELAVLARAHTNHTHARASLLVA